MPQDPLTLGLAAACALLLPACGLLLASRSGLKKRLAAAEAAAAPKPRIVEGRAEKYGLLWYPRLELDETARTVRGAGAGRPWCPKCLKPLVLLKGPPEEWECGPCGDKRAGTAADFQVMEEVVASTAREFLARNPEFRLLKG